MKISTLTYPVPVQGVSLQVNVKIDINEMAQICSPEQIQAIINGIAQVVSAQHNDPFQTKQPPTGRE